jgi:hypothetical protein
MNIWMKVFHLSIEKLIEIYDKIHRGEEGIMATMDIMAIPIISVIR